MGREPGEEVVEMSRDQMSRRMEVTLISHARTRRKRNPILTTGVSSRGRVDYLGSKLKGAAKRWYISMYKTRSPELDTVAKFLQALLNQYKDPLQETRALTALRDLQQGSKSVWEYTAKFRANTAKIRCLTLADGKVDLEAFKRGVKAMMKAEKRVAVSKLQYVLADLGIHLTQEELQQALQLAMVNEDGTVNLKDFLWAAQAIPSIQNKKVKIGDLNSALDALGIYLTHEELQEALKLTKLNEDGTVNLNELIRACNATLTLPSTRTRYLSQRPDAKMLKLPKVTDKNHPRTLDSVLSSSISDYEKTKFKATRTLTNAQLEAFHAAYDAFCKDLDGKIDLAALEATANNLGISLTEEEAFEELVCADMDGDGKVNFTDFLNVVTNSKRFVQAVAPKKGSMETVDARGILFFELVSKLVETSALPKKTVMAIVSYYRQKFLESTGKKAWHDDEKRHHWGKKGSHAPKKESSSLAAFAGAGRIVVMKDKELETFVKNLQENASPSDSPYAKIPVFPLIPNRDCVMAGKPKKDLHRLEAQRRMEPVSSFENHFFHKRKWLPESKFSRSARPSLILSPELTSRSRRLTINNLDEIRREVKKTTENYRKGLAMRERNKSLKLWRRLRGGEIGLETGNPSFYQTFSTYSWSWNVCQELLTPQELQKYDNRLYHSLSRSGSPADKLIKADRKQTGSKA
ncbi:EF-hand calcium-binding domain-containing protein 13 [Heteronotia binoei]|uniref:EF-hand calcium-binding domain-containing protein 13 n=1 Tax=Heteronotia binoei TaxID=13085 RepID=UPI0029313DD4|nr:EF-hand calcium-binding domain-containing protein 13 [Heteronotia binoei]